MDDPHILNGVGPASLAGLCTVHHGMAGKYANVDQEHVVGIRCDGMVVPSVARPC
jgi:hypothetical protein